MRRKGIVYDTGVRPGGRSSRPHFTAIQAKQELALIEMLRMFVLDSSGATWVPKASFTALAAITNARRCITA